eukprot:scaffold649307_cov48-Prasinocladus_malaysianus.AAC.2
MERSLRKGTGRDHSNALLSFFEISMPSCRSDGSWPLLQEMLRRLRKVEAEPSQPLRPLRPLQQLSSP